MIIYYITQLFPMDKRCVTVLVTLDHLLKFCTPVNRTSMSRSVVPLFTPTPSLPPPLYSTSTTVLYL